MTLQILWCCLAVGLLAKLRSKGVRVFGKLHDNADAIHGVPKCMANLCLLIDLISFYFQQVRTLSPRTEQSCCWNDCSSFVRPQWLKDPQRVCNPLLGSCRRAWHLKMFSLSTRPTSPSHHAMVVLTLVCQSAFSQMHLFCCQNYICFGVCGMGIRRTVCVYHLHRWINSWERHRFLWRE